MDMIVSSSKPLPDWMDSVLNNPIPLKVKKCFTVHFFKTKFRCKLNAPSVCPTETTEKQITREHQIEESHVAHVLL